MSATLEDTDRSKRSGIDFGYATRTVASPWFSWRIPVRIATVSLALLIVAMAFGAAALRYGDYPLTLNDVLLTLTGRGHDFHEMIVVEWRLPIIIAAITFGAILGIGGAIFQSLTRNPLGSPDVIGFDAGSYTAVVVMMLLVGTRDYWSLAGAAIGGGVLTAFVVYALAYRRGIQGFRLIIVGIGVSAMLGSINAYLITRANLEDAMSVGFWGAGSLARVTWGSMVPALCVMAVIVAASALLAPALRRMEMGDDAALTLGTRVGRDRLALIVVGVATVALVTAAAGPIAFVALVAPQLARRLTRSPGVSLLSAAAMGAALLAAAQFLSLFLAAHYRVVPVGLITVCVGGTYLIGLLIHESRRYRTSS